MALSETTEPDLLRGLAVLIERRRRMDQIPNVDTADVELSFTHGRSLSGYIELAEAMGEIASEHFGEFQQEAMRRLDEQIADMRREIAEFHK